MEMFVIYLPEQMKSLKFMCVRQHQSAKPPSLLNKAPTLSQCGSQQVRLSIFRSRLGWGALEKAWVWENSHGGKDVEMYNPSGIFHHAMKSGLPVLISWLPCMSLVCPRSLQQDPSWRGMECDKERLVGTGTMVMCIHQNHLIDFCVNMWALAKSWIFMFWAQNFRFKRWIEVPPCTPIEATTLKCSQHKIICGPGERDTPWTSPVLKWRRWSVGP